MRLVSSSGLTALDATLEERSVKLIIEFLRDLGDTFAVGAESARTASTTHPSEGAAQRSIYDGTNMYEQHTL